MHRAYGRDLGGVVRPTQARREELRFASASADTRPRHLPHFLQPVAYASVTITSQYAGLSSIKRAACPVFSGKQSRSLPVPPKGSKITLWSLRGLRNAYGRRVRKLAIPAPCVSFPISTPCSLVVSNQPLGDTPSRLRRNNSFSRRFPRPNMFPVSLPRGLN